jgi:signal peptidase I
MRNWLKDNRGFIAFLLCLGFFRLAIADWNPVPSGSMRPTLLEGDVVLVNRLAYDFKLPLSDTALLRLGEPQRGDVITFSSPKDGVRLIKRLVALPGRHGGDAQRGLVAQRPAKCLWWSAAIGGTHRPRDGDHGHPGQRAFA